MNEKIKSFLTTEKNLSLCTAIDNTPHCARCFYAFMSENNFLIFKSDRNSKHITNALINDRIAGTIIPDIQKMGTIKGVQFIGKFVMLSDEMLEKAKNKYYLKYPFAIVIPGELWAVELLSIKMIDNTLGFGNKITWQKDSPKEIEVSL